MAMTAIWRYVSYVLLWFVGLTTALRACGMNMLLSGIFSIIILGTMFFARRLRYPSVRLDHGGTQHHPVLGVRKLDSIQGEREEGDREDVLPAVFYQSMPMGATWVARRALLHPIHLQFSLVVSSVLIAQWRKDVALCWLLACALALHGWGVIFPRYIRIIPGRLDVLVFCLWRTEAIRVRYINIRDARLIHDDDRSQLVRIECGSEPPVEVALGGLGNPDRVLAVLAAAAKDPRPTPNVCERSLSF